MCTAVFGKEENEVVFDRLYGRYKRAALRLVRPALLSTAFVICGGRAFRLPPHPGTNRHPTWLIPYTQERNRRPFFHCRHERGGGGVKKEEERKRKLLIRGFAAHRWGELYDGGCIHRRVVRFRRRNQSYRVWSERHLFKGKGKWWKTLCSTLRQAATIEEQLWKRRRATRGKRSWTGLRAQ